MNNAATLAGIASAAIAALALCGVAVSLVMQARQVRIAQLQTVRNAQMRVAELAIADPALACGPDASSQDRALYATTAYTNLQLKQLELGFATGILSRRSIEIQAALLFEQAQNVEFWVKYGWVYEQEAHGKREHAFFEIVNTTFDSIDPKRSLSSSASSSGGHDPGGGTESTTRPTER